MLTYRIEALFGTKAGGIEGAKRKQTATGAPQGALRADPWARVGHTCQTHDRVPASPQDNGGDGPGARTKERKNGRVQVRLFLGTPSGISCGKMPRYQDKIRPNKDKFFAFVNKPVP